MSLDEDFFREYVELLKLVWEMRKKPRESLRAARVGTQ